MHKEILVPEQIEVLPIVKEFGKEYYLVGGTAIALYLGHRRSIDFDLFKYKKIKPKNILETINSYNYQHVITRRVTEQLNITIHKVKFTFYQYPFKINATEPFDDIIHIPGLIDLVAMKAYALGRRSKWKDYVDLFFFLKEHSTINEIAGRANEIYGELFSEKLFRAQLSYFDDIDYSEPVEFIGAPIPDSEIKEFLIDKATDIF